MYYLSINGQVNFPYETLEQAEAGLEKLTLVAIETGVELNFFIYSIPYGDMDFKREE